MEEHYWTTSSGEEIEISKMTTSHIQNAIRCLERKAEAEKVVTVTEWCCGIPEEDWVVDEEWLAECKEYDWLKEELARREGIDNRGLKPSCAVVQVCFVCGKIDAYKDDGHDCLVEAARKMEMIYE